MGTVQSGDGTFLLMLMAISVLGAAIFVIGSSNHSRISQAGGLLIIGAAAWLGTQLFFAGFYG